MCTPLVCILSANREHVQIYVTSYTLKNKCALLQYPSFHANPSAFSVLPSLSLTSQADREKIQICDFFNSP